MTTVEMVQIAGIVLGVIAFGFVAVRVSLFALGLIAGAINAFCAWVMKENNDL